MIEQKKPVARRSDRPAPIGSSNGSLPVLLVVDDEPDLRLLVRITLGDSGFDVLEASDGREALSVMDAHHVALVLLDAKMPHLDGWGVLEQLRTSDRLERTRVIMLSAHAGADTARRAREAGCLAYVQKPFDPTELRDLVKDVLTHSGG